MSRPAPYTGIPSYCLHKARGTAYVEGLVSIAVT
jgi:hypothetical protein